MTYPQPINPGDVTEGMALTITTTWADGSQRTISGTITGAGTTFLTTSTGDTIDLTEAGTTLQLDEAPPTDATPPAVGTIFEDSAGAAWQATGSDQALTLEGIAGDRLTWAEFVDTHPTFTVLQDVPAVPLPDPPPTGYPVTITPDDGRLGMDIRVTSTTPGGTKIVRGICAWNQQDGDPTNENPDYLVLSLSTGDYFAYNPVPDGETLLVEQMQAWTADSVWDNAAPEPPIGTIVRSRSGVAWQRTGDATADGPLIDGTGPWYLAGQGMWSSVGGDYPRSWLWLWGAAAPFIVQQPA